MYIVLLGAPGAGKGTQASALAKQLGLAHVASGDLFRDHLERGTELGKLAKSSMERGELVSNDITIRMILERLAEPDCARGAILDGFPRTLEQAGALDEALARQGRQIDRVVYLKVSKEALIDRLAGRWICRVCQTPYHLTTRPPRVAGRCDVCGGELYQRPDDQEETVRKRLDVYFANTAPLIESYLDQGKLAEVDGQQSIEAVRDAVIAAALA